MKTDRLHFFDNRSKHWRLIALCISIVLLASILLLFFNTLQNKKDTDISNVNTVKALVSALYLLPANEEPALATVTDRNKISSSLAGKVQNGDKILFYENNRQAIVYRPSINRVVGVIPLQIDSVESLNKN